jgi:polysaccharide export outer membrane protein
MRRHSVISVVLLFLVLVSSRPALAGQAASAPTVEDTPNLKGPKPTTLPPYIVQPNDLLEIYVWKDQNLTRKVTVRPDGRISFPLIQDMQVAGLSPEAIKSEIEKRLKEYIEAPNVTVIVEAIQSYRVFVTGKVAKPGALMVEKPISVLQALALAGGFLEFANPAEMVIIRNTGEDSILFRFNYVEAVKGKNFNQNILLKSGDVIVVP